MSITDTDYELVYKRLNKKARKDLLTFLYLLEPQDESASYKLTKVHRLLAEIFQGMVDGRRGKNQSVSMPPRHGKSQTLSVRAVAWYVAAFRGRVALTGFSHTLLVGFLKDIKAVWATPEFNRVFPEFSNRAYKTNTLTDVQFVDGACVQVRSAGSKLTGLGFSLLIVDDAHAGRAEAESHVQRKHVKDWFFADCLSRLEGFTNPEGRCVEPATLIIGTRWHPQDLIGHLISDEYVEELKGQGQGELVYEVTNLPALCEDPASDPLGREEGEALAPDVRSREFLLGQKAQIPAYEWESQYQGQPKSSGSDQVDVTKINYCTADDIPDEAEFRRGWDFAVTEKQKSDFTAGAALYYCKPTKEEEAFAKKHKLKALPTVYLYHIHKKKLAWAKMKPQVIDMSRADKKLHNANIMAMEAVSGFEIGRAELKKSLLGEVKVELRNPPKGGKLLRAQEWMNLIEAGRFYVVRGDWNKDFVEELRVFPDGDHDDQVDAVSIAFESLHRKKKIMVR